MNQQFQQTLGAGERVVGTWISIGHPAIGEISAQFGFDFVVIDMEHTSMGVDEVEAVIRAVEASGENTAPIVRVADHDQHGSSACSTSGQQG